MVEKFALFEKEEIIKYSNYQKQYFFWKYIFNSN